MTTKKDAPRPAKSEGETKRTNATMAGKSNGAMGWNDLIDPPSAQLALAEDSESVVYPFDIGALIEAVPNEDRILYLALDRFTFESMLCHGLPVTVAYFDMPQRRRMRCDLPDIVADWGEYRARIVSMELCPPHTQERAAINAARSFTASCLEEWAAYFTRAGLKSAHWHIIKPDAKEVKLCTK